METSAVTVQVDANSFRSPVLPSPSFPQLYAGFHHGDNHPKFILVWDRYSNMLGCIPPVLGSYHFRYSLHFYEIGGASFTNVT